MHTVFQSASANLHPASTVRGTAAPHLHHGEVFMRRGCQTLWADSLREARRGGMQGDHPGSGWASGGKEALPWESGCGAGGEEALGQVVSAGPVGGPVARCSSIPQTPRWWPPRPCDLILGRSPSSSSSSPSSHDGDTSANLGPGPHPDPATRSHADSVWALGQGSAPLWASVSPSVQEEIWVRTSWR